MKRCRCLVFVFLSLFALFAAPQAAFPDDSEKDALLENLRRAREDWIENASFCGHFTYRQQLFFSEEEAMAAETPDGGIKTRGTHGFIAKLNHKYRLQTICEYDDNEKVIGPLSEDTVANDRFCLTVEHTLNTINDMQLPFDGLVAKVPEDPNFILPFISEYGFPCSFFSNQIIAYTETSEINFDIECTRKENGRFLLTLTKNISDKNTTVKEELIIRNDRDFPVIEQVKRTTAVPSATVTITSKVLEWSDCGGFAVPARIRTVQGTQLAQQEGAVGDHWQMSEWVSEDLGERPPREKDFAVKVQWGDLVLHLKKPWWKRTIHIDKLTDRNYDPEIPDFIKNPDKYPPRKKRLREEDLCLKLGFSAAGLALIALALVMKYRARKKRAASA